MSFTRNAYGTGVTDVPPRKRTYSPVCGSVSSMSVLSGWLTRYVLVNCWSDGANTYQRVVASVPLKPGGGEARDSRWAGVPLNRFAAAFTAGAGGPLAGAPACT